jgi:hypothetical protein
MAEDPTCTWQPAEELLPESVPVTAELPSGDLDGSVEWTPEAQKRLKRIPIFLRGMIRKRLEEKALQLVHGLAENAVITPDFMAEHRKQREHELGIKFEERSL